MSDAKRKLDTEDIVNLLLEFDAAGLRLPTFTAANLKRIPPFEPDATDICSLTAAVGQLQTQLGETNAKLCAVIDYVSVMNSGTNDRRQTSSSSDHHGSVGLLVDQQSPADQFGVVGETSLATTEGPVTTGNSATSTSVTTPSPESADAASGVSEAGPRKTPLWTSVLNAGTESSNAWSVVSPRRAAAGRTAALTTSRPKSSVKLTGSRSMSTSGQTVKAVPRKAVLSAYVGRLQKNTTEEALTCFLSEVGLKGVVCKKLKAKDGKVFHTAAFYVTCSVDCKALFYDESIWPEGAELRDWVYFN